MTRELPTPAMLPALRLELAEAEITLRASQDACKAGTAIAEKDARLRLGESIGKNEAERSVNIAAALACDPAHERYLTRLRDAEAAVTRLEAMIKAAEDTRRAEEWQEWARMRAVLGRQYAEALDDEYTDAVWESQNGTYNGVTPTVGAVEEDYPF